MSEIIGTIDKAREIWREEILAAMDKAARRIYGRKITRNDCGAIDADLPELFKALDAQLDKVDSRFGPLQKNFYFSISNGVDGYLPDNVEHYHCENSIDAFDAICEAIRHFREYGATDQTEEFEEFDWRGFFERGCACPDASTWSFRLAGQGDEILTLQGMTESEYSREMGE